MLGKTPPPTCSTLLDHMKVSAKGLGLAPELARILIRNQYLGQARGGEQVKEEGTVPGTAASGLLVVSEPELARIALFPDQYLGQV